MAYAVVYRFEGYKPEQLLALQKHHAREAGDLEHCDPDRFDENIVTFGNRDSWAEEFLAEVEVYKELNMRNECSALNARGRATEAKRRRVKGGQDPWKKSNELGVVRGVLLTVNADFFRQEGFEDFDGADFRDPVKCEQFMSIGNAWIEAKIPRDYWLFGTWEFDEHGLHFHGYYRAWNTKETKTKGVQRMLQPTDMAHFRNAELAQTQVAEHFAPLGLVRAKETAKARREARAEGRVPPAKAKHVKPHQYRMQQRLALVEAEKQARAAEQAAETKAAEEKAAREAATLERNKLAWELAAQEARRAGAEFEHYERLREAEKASEARRAEADRKAAERRELEEAQLEQRKIDHARSLAGDRRRLLEQEHDLRRMADEFLALAETVKEAARNVGMAAHPLIKPALAGLAKMRKLARDLHARNAQRQRQR